MRRAETFIRMTELGLALASTYMAAVTLLQASLYAKFRPLLLRLGGAILGGLNIDLAYLDLIPLALAMVLALLFWRRGDEAGFGRLFSLNMFMFFPAVLDFSTFNWVNLILPYDPAPRVSLPWVFGVGVLLQVTYLGLRYTVRFRELRGELIGRGAELEDVDGVSKGQMTYLALLLAGTAIITVVIYYAAPILKGMLKLEAVGLPYMHIVIGVACTILIAAAMVIYLRGQGAKSAAEPKGETPTKPERSTDQFSTEEKEVVAH